MHESQKKYVILRRIYLIYRYMERQDKTKKVVPAEWAPQSAVMLTWPHSATDWLPILPEITHTYVQMAQEIVKRERLVIVTPEPNKVRQLLPHSPRITYVKCATNDTWARDHAFITLVDRKQQLPFTGIQLLDFRFNGWGEKFPADLDNAINRQLFNAGAVNGEYVNHLDFVLEGGAIESDGEGTIFTTTGCLMAPHRNQPLTQDDIERQLIDRLHADRVIWIDHGHLIGDDTDGHIDTLVRVAPADTLLYMGCDDENDPQYAELHKMEEELRLLQTKSGRGYRLLRLPLPRPIYHEGERLPATYANFLVINDAVLYPTYDQPDLDAEAAQVIADAFPDRDIIGIDCRPVIIQHGSLHCCTMQFPAGVVLKNKSIS